MNKKYILTKTATIYTKPATILTVFENDKPIDISLVYEDEQSELNNIYVGHVKDVVKNINSAFVDYEKGKTAYLSLNDCKNPIFINPKNTDKICQSDNILVQLIKEPVKTKFGVLTTDITFSGKYVVFIADNQNNISISTKIKDKEYISNIKETLSKITNGCSFIVRTAAYEANVQDVVEEANQFIEKYLNIVSIAVHRPAYTLLHKGCDVNIQLIKDTLSPDDIIITDSKELLDEVNNSLKGYSFESKLYEDDLLPLYKLYNIEGVLKEINQTNIWLKSGAYIVIEYTEAMTVIDVNTGKCIKGKDRNKTFLNINIEAATEILRQLRLRNISGIIMCDFINMDNKEDDEILINEIISLAKKDRIPINVLGMTRLKLLEMTRKKLRDRVSIRKI